jgi:protocatechuate 3,4-dioxygenase beta subunit
MKTRVSLAIALLSIAAIGLYFWSQSKTKTEGESASSTAKVVGAPAGGTNAGVTPAQDLRTIDGRVLQADGSPLGGASVQIVPHKKRSTRLGAHDAVTGSRDDGGWTLVGIPPGDYMLSASAAGFLPARVEIHVEASSDLHEQVLQLEAGGQGLSGEVSDLTGGKVASAIVHVIPMSTSGLDRQGTASAQTNAVGHYELNLRPGRYLVQALHVDYVPKAQLIEVGSASQTLDFGLAPGAVVEGVVRHLDSDEVMPGAVISYATERLSRFDFFANSVGGGSVHADEQGHFRISGLNSGSLQLSARADNAATTEPTRVALGIAEQRTDVELYLSGAYRLAGKVIDDATKEPIAGIEVSASSDGQEVSARAPSDEEGRFEIAGLTRGKYRLSGDGGDYLPKLFGQQVEVSGDVEDALLELSRGAMILGRVEPAGVAEIGVDLETIRGVATNTFRRVKSEPDGSFAFGPLDPASFRLQAKGEGGTLGFADVELPKTGLRDVVIKLEERGSISGRVVDASGNAASDVTVKVRADSGGRSMSIMFNGQDMMANSAHTGPDGSFHISGLKAGPYKITVVDEQGETLPWADEGKATGKGPRRVAAKKVSLAKQEELEGRELRVQSRDASISGTVIGPDGNPAPDVWVTAASAQSMPMGMPELPSRDGPPGPRDSEEDTVETSTRVMMVVSDGGGGDSDGPGLDLGRGGELPPVLTNERGEFTVKGLREGKYDLIAEGMRGSARGFTDGAKTNESAVIRLQQLTRIEGKVTLGDSPAQSFVVELSGVSSRRKRVRDDKGAFTLHRVDPGKYTVTVRSDEGEAKAEVTVEAGKATKVELKMDVLTKVRGTLVDEDGKPIAGAIVTPVPRTDDGSMNLMIGDDAELTNSQGAFEFGVRPGKYLLLAIKPGAGPLTRRPLDVA